MLKKILSLFICMLTLISGFVSTGVFSFANNEAANEITSEPNKSSNPVTFDTAGTVYSGSCGDNLTWSIDTHTGILEISGTGNMYDYFYNPSPWMNYKSYIKSIVIGNSVTSIGDEAFFNLHLATSVTIPDSVTTIGMKAFDYCYKLNSITIGNSVTFIENGAFENTAYYNNNANWINGVLYIGNYLIKANESISASYSIKQGTLAVAEKAFYNCKSLTDITVPNTLRAIGNSAFSGCSALTGVYISDLSAWIGIKYAFYESSNPLYYAKNLYLNNTLVTDLVVPDAVDIIEKYAFCNCTSITNVTISNSVVVIGEYAFSGCSSLVTMTMGESVAEIQERAFKGCSALTSIKLSGSVTSIENSVFKDCVSLENITVSDNNTDYASLDGVLYSKDMNTLISYPVNAQRTHFEIPSSVTNIDDMAFSSCKNLTSVTIPDSVEIIGASAFYGCSSITSISIPNSVKIIETCAFADCHLLNDISLPDSVEQIGFDAFIGTAYYKNSANWSDGILYIGNHLIKAEQDINGSFTVCNDIVSVAENAFSDCTSLKSITFPNTLRRIGQAAFYCCSNLESVYIPDSVTYIGAVAFEDCDKLESIIIPDSVEYLGAYAFSYCPALKEITIGNSIDSIEMMTFNSCTSLKELVIPDSVKTIKSNAFSGCKSLESITIPSSVKTIEDDAFESSDPVIRCYLGSYALSYAVTAGMAYDIICDHIFTEYITIKAATCTEDEVLEAYCNNNCGKTDRIISEGSALGHSWTEWITTIDPTYTTNGERVRFCRVCSTTDGEILPKLEAPADIYAPVISVDNFTVTITNAEYIKDMRYALGIYSTTTEIRNAEGNVALDNGIVTSHTVAGNFVYTMPNGGMYSIWIRMKDGTNYILPLDITNVTASVSSYGVKITIHGLFDIKDFFIAKGEYNTYNEIKQNGYIFSATSAKLKNMHSYTYTVSQPGIHTVLVRYNNGDTAVFHEKLTVDEPVFSTNGLQITVSNIKDVKTIRTAYGEYSTAGEIKRAPGARNFSGKDIKGAEEYIIQYRENGIVTVAVEYNNGYVKTFCYTVQMKQAKCMQVLSTVIFDNLDGFVMIRYAPGEYTTSAQIKRAIGAKVLKPADLTEEYAVISGLSKDTYTFCVQFDDESYNYYVITVTD